MLKKQGVFWQFEVKFQMFDNFCGWFQFLKFFKTLYLQWQSKAMNISHLHCFILQTYALLVTLHVFPEFEIRKNLDLRKILSTPKIFLKSRFHCILLWVC